MREKQCRNRLRCVRAQIWLESDFVSIRAEIAEFFGALIKRLQEFCAQSTGSILLTFRHLFLFLIRETRFPVIL